MKKHIISAYLFSVLCICFDTYSMKRAEIYIKKGQNNPPAKKQKTNSIDTTATNSCLPLITAMKQLIQMLPDFERPGSCNSFIEGIESGDQEHLVYLLESEHTSLSGETALGTSLIRWALINNHDDIVKLLVKRGINLKHTQLIHVTLMRACIKGYEDIVENLLKYNNIRVDTKDCFGHNPLIKAIGCGHINIAKMLVNYRPEAPEIRSNMIIDTFNWAMRNGRTNVMKALDKYIQ